MVSFFLYPLIPSSIPTSHHFSPLLFIHLFHCGKCGKICGKLATFAHKCLISRHKILINTLKSCQNTLLDILFLAFLICCIPYILGTMVPSPSFARKDFVFSPRPLTSFGSPSNRFSFIEPSALKRRNRLRRVVIFKKSF